MTIITFIAYSTSEACNYLFIISIYNIVVRCCKKSITECAYPVSVFYMATKYAKLLMGGVSVHMYLVL